MSSCPGVWYQSGGLRQLHHERDNPMGRRGVRRPEGWGASCSADEEQRLHAAGVCASRG